MGTTNWRCTPASNNKYHIDGNDKAVTKSRIDDVRNALLCAHNYTQPKIHGFVPCSLFLPWSLQWRQWKCLRRPACGRRPWRRPDTSDASRAQQTSRTPCGTSSEASGSACASATASAAHDSNIDDDGDDDDNDEYRKAQSPPTCPLNSLRLAPPSISHAIVMMMTMRPRRHTPAWCDGLPCHRIRAKVARLQWQRIQRQRRQRGST